VGYEDAGQLTEMIRRRPFSIVVFDEIEKAHPEAFNMLLQIMEEGNLSDAKGHKVDFRNAIIVMTSNVGAEMIKRQTSLGFAAPRDEVAEAERDYQEMRKKLLDQLKRTFRPEFLNRVDNVIVFHALSREDIARIVILELDKVRARLAEYHMELTVTEATRELLAKEGYSEEYGARPLRRVIQTRIEDALSDAILAGRFNAGDRILVDAEDDEIVLSQAEKAEEAEEEPDPESVAA
jgi:ATP-dependent Clp protease ATP-binding subunit ClpC